jgi:hypothetical protein
MAADDRYTPGYGPKIGSFLIFVAGLALIMAWFTGGAYTETYPRPFDSGAWKAAEDDWGDTRCGMIADLQFRIGLEGKSRREIIRLLGAANTDDADVSVWLLCPSFLDYWILEIRWHNGRALSAIVRDT